MNIKSLKTNILIGFIALASTSVYGQKTLSPHAAMIAEKAELKRDAMLSAYLTVDKEVFNQESLDSLGAKVTIDCGNILSLRLPAKEITKVASLPGVLYVQSATPATPMLDVASPLMSMPEVHSGTAAITPYTGKGVIIGVVDSGFDYAHTAFKDANGHLRISRVWEQNTLPKGDMQPPERFGYGVELIGEDMILSAGGDIRDNSHGTHVTSIAAGYDQWFGGEMTGMAPDAEIVLVSMTEAGVANVNISDAIAYIYDYADSRDMPCVVNLSLGSHNGPHDGTSTFDVLTDAMQGAGRLIVGASGNTVNPFHVSRTLAPEAEPLRTFVDYRAALSENNKGGDIEIWAEQGMHIEVSLVVYKLSTAAEVERVEVYPSAEPTATVGLGRNVTGNYQVASEVCQLNGKEHVLLTSGVTAMRTGYAIAIEVKALSAGEVNIWADNVQVGLTDKGIEGFATQTVEPTICEIGGTAHRILTVGAYTTRNTYRVLNEQSDRHLSERDGDMASFSCHGPTADRRMKPQVCAPGCFISAAVSSNDRSGTQILSRKASDEQRDYLYGYMQGTSMASPMVAGIVATWLQAYRQLTPEQVAEVVRSTAINDEFTGDIQAGDDRWGYGKINPLGGLYECIRLAEEGGVGSVSADAGDVVSIARDGDKIEFTMLQNDAAVAIEVYTPSGMLVSSHRSTKSSIGDIISLQANKGVSIIKVTTQGASKAYRMLTM